MALDPMTIISSQKVWPETSVGFFITLSIYWFIRALKSHRDIFFLLSGIASSLGVLCKYPGGIATLIICFYALFFDHRLFKKKKFIIGVLLPIFFLFPWLIWNFWVYKINFLFMQFHLHSDKFHTIILTRNIVLFGLLAVCSFILAKKIKRKHFELGRCTSPYKYKHIVYAIATVLFLPIFLNAILKSLNPYHIPVTSWTGATFYNSPPTFYINRLFEFSSIYLLGFVALFIKTSPSRPDKRILNLTILTVLGFYTIWQAYQSRYILAALPPLIILGSHFITNVYYRSCNIHSLLIRTVLRSAVALTILIMLIKLYIVNTTVSFTNDLCYF
jgi:4-amino-4-deoxy-L-arabinose transferase-like glycosyltransferase